VSNVVWKKVVWHVSTLMLSTNFKVKSHLR